MPVRAFNTLTRQKEPLNPITPRKVGIYVCGPTVDDDPHWGHARSAVVFDVITRYLRAKGYAVTHARNITDIDDKIIAKARRQGRDYRKLAAYYSHRYDEAMGRLHVRKPDAMPKATEYIAPIQEWISKLIQKGNAYSSGGDVYFAVESFRNYGRLSRRSVQSLSAEIIPPLDWERPVEDGYWFYRCHRLVGIENINWI